MTLLYFGVALVLNTLWALVLYPVLLVIMLFGVIFREERYLLLRFCTKYLKYKVSVRRWL
jgi:protein-S-isoprenylcysteine O-methyltransferase Ste14